MIIKTLIENTSCSGELQSEHGLSLYIETKKHKILFDLGKTDLFFKNAEKLNVNIEEIDLVIISHGHYDHGGGLKKFLDINSRANIYINKYGFEEHYSKRPTGIVEEIGLDKELKYNSRIIFVDKYLRIDEELEIFSEVKKNNLLSKSNDLLLVKEKGQFIQDNFNHEQSLIIRDNDKLILVAGCAHKGISNIIDEFIDIKREEPKYVLGGFHLSSPSHKKSEDTSLINEIGCYLKSKDSFYYTCHCTGLAPYNQLKDMLKERLQYLSTGTCIEI